MIRRFRGHEFWTGSHGMPAPRRNRFPAVRVSPVEELLKTMNILAIDGATGACSVALLSGDAVLSRRSARLDRGQAEILVPMVMDVLDEAGMGFPALDRLAVTVGPGSFTGVRIALATARAMALAADLPLVGVTTLEAYAHGVPAGLRGERSVLAAVDSRRAEPFLQLFGPGLEPAGLPAAVLPQDAAALLPGGPVLVVGDAVRQLEPFLAALPGVSFAEPDIPDPAVVARLAGGRPVPEVPPRPLYLRAPDVTLPPGEGRR
jgi:tRNA threonylcarbamoyladenosine biosynthesis protein TsaB